MGAAPPTIALFGKIPNGMKNACMDPPRPLVEACCTSEDLRKRAVEKEVVRKLLHVALLMPRFPSTTRESVTPPRNSFMMS